MGYKLPTPQILYYGSWLRERWALLGLLCPEDNTASLLPGHETDNGDGVRLSTSNGAPGIWKHIFSTLEMKDDPV